MSDDYSSDTQAEAPDFMAGLQNLRNQDFPGMSPEALAQLKMDSMRDLYPGDPMAQQTAPNMDSQNFGRAMQTAPNMDSQNFGRAMQTAPNMDSQNFGRAMESVKGLTNRPTQFEIEQGMRNNPAQQPRGPDWSSMMPRQVAENDIGGMMPKNPMTGEPISDQQVVSLFNQMKGSPEWMERLRNHDAGLHGFVTGLDNLSPENLRTNDALIDERKFTPQMQESLRKFLTSPGNIPSVLKMMRAQQ